MCKVLPTGFCLLSSPSAWVGLRDLDLKKSAVLRWLGLDPGVWNLEASQVLVRGENRQFLYTRFLPPQAQRASPIDCTFNAPYNRYVFGHLYFEHQSPDQNALTIGENSPIYPVDHQISCGSTYGSATGPRLETLKTSRLSRPADTFRFVLLVIAAILVSWLHWQWYFTQNPWEPVEWRGLDHRN